MREHPWTADARHRSLVRVCNVNGRDKGWALVPQYDVSHGSGGAIRTPLRRCDRPVSMRSSIAIDDRNLESDLAKRRPTRMTQV